MSKATQILISLDEMSPQSIEPTNFNLDDDVHNRQFLAKLSNEKYTVLKLNGAPSHFELRDYKNQLALIDKDESKIRYYLKYNISHNKFLNKKAISQVKVWSDIGSSQIRNLPTSIFFNHLLPKTGTIITDSHQTDDGHRFWSRRIGDAFELGHKVTYVNMLAPNKEKVKINNIAHYDKFSRNKEIWGHKQKHQARRIVISHDDI
jgi:hypothetical protein